MKKILLPFAIALSLAISTDAFSQSNDEVTLIFKRPFANIIGDGFYDTKITVNDVEACNINNDVFKLETCTYKTKAGEIKIIVSTTRGTDFENVFDVAKGKTYTLVVYQKNFQMYDMLWEEISSKVIANKVKSKEAEDINTFSYKALVISIK